MAFFPEGEAGIVSDTRGLFSAACFYLPRPPSFLSSFFTWRKVRWLLAVLQGCPVHKDGDVTSIRGLRRQEDKLAESLHLPPSIFRLHLASMSQVLPTPKLLTLAQEWAH